MCYGAWPEALVFVYCKYLYMSRASCFFRIEQQSEDYGKFRARKKLFCFKSFASNSKSLFPEKNFAMWFFEKEKTKKKSPGFL